MIRSVTAYVHKNTMRWIVVARGQVKWYDAGARGFDLGDYADLFASTYRFLIGPCWQWVQHHSGCAYEFITALFDT